MSDLVRGRGGDFCANRNFNSFEARAIGRVFLL